jgi:hypothetical protein
VISEASAFGAEVDCGGQPDSGDFPHAIAIVVEDEAVSAVLRQDAAAEAGRVMVMFAHRLSDRSDFRLSVR